ncbi:MAG TPA: EamA family transporter [Phycisphaerae bacterium]|nr:EamA family transporter [Phycisphaerae bacterium]
MMKYGIALTAALILNAAANLMMKVGVRRLGESGLGPAQGPGAWVNSMLSNWVLILGLAFFASNVVLYTYALSGIRISVAYPIMVGGAFAIIALVAWKYLGETLTAGQWLGVGIILLGVFLVARQMQNPAG